MRTHIELLRAAVNTHGADNMYTLLEEALEVIKTHESKAARLELRNAALVAQVGRQTTMIDNLEKTLWSKK